jgi:hypothetical protein
VIRSSKDLIVLGCLWYIVPIKDQIHSRNQNWIDQPAVFNLAAYWIASSKCMYSSEGSVASWNKLKTRKILKDASENRTHCLTVICRKWWKLDGIVRKECIRNLILSESRVIDKTVLPPLPQSVLDTKCKILNVVRHLF